MSAGKKWGMVTVTTVKLNMSKGHELNKVNSSTAKGVDTLLRRLTGMHRLVILYLLQLIHRTAYKLKLAQYVY